MKVPAANVILSFSKESLERFFTEGVPYKTLIKELSKDPNVILLNNYSSANLIEFKHSMLGEQGTRFRLSFIDPTGNIESRFISDNLAEYAYSQLPITPNKITEAIKKDQENELKAKVDVVNSFSNLFREDINKRFYIIYGIGDDLDNWSGPHIVTLVGADLNIQGARKITLDFVPEFGLSFGSRRGMYNEYINLKESLPIEIEAKSFPIEIYKDFYYRDQYLDSLSKSSLINETIPPETFDVHLLVTDVIRDYIKKATNNRSNVVVLLPDLNEVCAQAIDEAVKYVGAPTAQTPTQTINRPSNNSPLNSNSFNSGGDPDAEFGLTQASEEFFTDAPIAPSVTVQNTDVVVDKFNTTVAILELFGLEFATKELNNKTPISSPFLNAIQQQDKAVSYLDRMQKYLSTRVLYGIKLVRDENGLPNLQEGLNEISKAIIAASRTTSRPQIHIMYESSLLLSKVWSDPLYSNFPLFNGFDENKPTIIYGDIRLINEYLYCQRNGKETINYVYPYDKVILSNESYYNKVNGILNPRKKIVTPYGAVSQIPDEFSFDLNEDTKEAATLIEASSIPVFRYNTTNPNVLDIRGKFNAAYLGALFYSIERDVARKASLGVEGVIPTKYGNFEFKDINSILGYIRYREKQLGAGSPSKRLILSEIATKLKNDVNLSPLILGSTPEEKAQFCIEYYDLLLKEDRPVIKIDQLFPGDPINITYDIAERLYSTALSIEIKSLPMFHLSKFSNIGKSCILFAQFPGIVQTLNRPLTLIDKFLTGHYLIYGITNTISMKEIHSEFSLTKVGSRVNPNKETNKDSLEVDEL